MYSSGKYGDSHFSTFFAAVDYRRWNGGSVCGKCARVTGAKGTYLVKIVDYCAKGYCGKNDLDFSTGALEAITGYSWDYKPITWEWADCDGPKVGKAPQKRDKSKKKCAEWTRYNKVGSYVDRITYTADCRAVMFCKDGHRIDFKTGKSVDKKACKRYRRNKKN